MKNYYIIMMAALALLSACSNDKNNIKGDDLQGTWVCKKASDNGENSDLIPGAEVIFKGSKFTFPILENVGKAKEQDFIVKNDEIQCKNDKELIFKIKELKDKKMSLQFSLEGHDLVLEMEKTK